MDNAQASLLDRLIDMEPTQSREPVQYRLLNVRQVMANVVRDLENLLNSRRTIARMPPGLHHLVDSVAAYGLKDFTAENTGSQEIRRALRQDVEWAIRRFEPRLRNVTVVLETGAERERRLNFRISAVLVVDPIREAVVFDTYFDAIRKEYVVSE